MSAKRRRVKTKYPGIYMLYTLIGNAVIFILLCAILAIFVSGGKISESTIRIMISVIALLSGALAYKLIAVRSGEERNAVLCAVINFGVIMCLGAIFGGETLNCAINAAISSIGMMIGSVLTKRINRRRG